MKDSKDFTFDAPVKPVKYMVEVARSIEQDATDEVGFTPPMDFLITGGTIVKTLHGKNELDFYSEYVSALKWGGRRRFVNLQSNAQDKDTMKHYRTAGVDCHHSNMEVWEKRLFEWINPGKNRRVGWDGWVRSRIDEVDIFGEGNVRPNFVGGVEMAKPYGFKTVAEAVKSTSDGVDFMMSQGIIRASTNGAASRAPTWAPSGTSRRFPWNIISSSWASTTTVGRSIIYRCRAANASIPNDARLRPRHLRRYSSFERTAGLRRSLGSRLYRMPQGPRDE